MAYASKKVVEYCENRKKATTGNCVLFSVNNELVAKPEDFKEVLAMINSQSGDIFELAKTGTPDELQQALDSGIDVNIQDKFGYTPLLRAIKVNRFDNVRFLIEKGADISIKENLGSDALNMAVYSRYNNINLVKFLLEKGADVSTKTKRPGDTPLHNAAELGRLNVLQLLLDRGVDVNQRNNYTETALHKAADQGHVKVLRYLLDNGANINTQTRRGITPHKRQLKSLTI